MATRYSKETTTKNGRRTWRVTYELVRGPEPKGRGSKASRAKVSPSKPDAAAPGLKKAARRGRSPRKRRAGNQNQLGLF